MRYSSKLLLFGEHTINRGSNALAMPYPAFGGEWAYAEHLTQQQNLSYFADYLQNLQQEGKLLATMDVAAFRQELAQGLYFHSNIPIGYGLGSFVEIEAIDLNGDKTEAKLLEQCRFYMDLLNIRSEDLLENSYSDM